MPRELRDRRWRVEIGYASGRSDSTVLDISELDIEFDVKKDLSRQPNKGTVKVYNLSKEHRAALARASAEGGLFVRLSAGYAANTSSLLLVGDVTKVSTTRNEVDVVTALEARDGGVALQSSRASRSFVRGTSVEDVLRALVAEMGIGEGNLATYTPDLAFESGDRTLRSGLSIEGSTRVVLTNFLHASGLRWSVQDGALQIRPRGRAALARAIVLSPATGLVGSPQSEEKGKVSATSLLQPGFIPGGIVVLRSADFDGSYLIREVTYQGATRGTPWYAALKLEPQG
jgi:hypothetical protein